jgi:hypothetical protein
VIAIPIRLPLTGPVTFSLTVRRPTSFPGTSPLGFYLIPNPRTAALSLLLAGVSLLSKGIEIGDSCDRAWFEVGGRQNVCEHGGVVRKDTGGSGYSLF